MKYHIPVQRIHLVTLGLAHRGKGLQPIPTEFCLQGHCVFQVLAKFTNGARNISIWNLNFAV